METAPLAAQMYLSLCGNSALYCPSVFLSLWKQCPNTAQVYLSLCGNSALYCPSVFIHLNVFIPHLSMALFETEPLKMDTALGSGCFVYLSNKYHSLFPLQPGHAVCQQISTDAEALRLIFDVWRR